MKAVLALMGIAIAVVVGYLAMEAGDEGGGDIQDSTSDTKLAAVIDRVNELEERNRELERDLSAARRSPGEPGVTAAEVEAIVSRLLAARGRGEVAADEPEAAEAPPEADAEPLDIKSALASLADPNIAYDDRWEILMQLSAAGLTDDVIAHYEQLAKERAGDPEVHTDLGEAYIAKLIGGTTNFMEQGTLSAKALKAYDKALELDPDHWRARVNKGASLYWSPPQLGRQGEALKELERAAGLQAKMEPQDGFSGTHLMIGNLYQQLGKPDEARAAWQRGLDRFPNDKDLRKQIEGSK